MRPRPLNIVRNVNKCISAAGNFTRPPAVCRLLDTNTVLRTAVV